jgi:uncharacterized membrane protein
MNTPLRDALVRARAWGQHHVPSLPHPHVVKRQTVHTYEDRLADSITQFAGSMTFVYLHVVWFGTWLLINLGLLVSMGLKLVPFDPFPFGLLTLVVSLEAIFLSTFVMIAQNRLSAIADARAQADYEIDRKAEAEVAKILHLLEALVEHHILLVDDDVTDDVLQSSSMLSVEE